MCSYLWSITQSWYCWINNRYFHRSPYCFKWCLSYVIFQSILCKSSFPPHSPLQFSLCAFSGWSSFWKRWSDFSCWFWFAFHWNLVIRSILSPFICWSFVVLLLRIVKILCLFLTGSGCCLPMRDFCLFVCFTHSVNSSSFYWLFPLLWRRFWVWYIPFV